MQPYDLIIFGKFNLEWRFTTEKPNDTTRYHEIILLVGAEVVDDDHVVMKVAFVFFLRFWACWALKKTVGVFFELLDGRRYKTKRVV